jgi:hypothetical protein
MQPFNGDAALAAKTVAEMKAHRAADRLTKGQYWEAGRGCAIGCLVQSSSHGDAAALCNAPAQIMGLVDCIFEGLPWPANLDWPVKFLVALKANLNKDISLLWARLALELAGHPVHGYEQYNQDPAVLAVPPLYEEWVATGVRPDDDRWRAAARAAYAAGDAAYAAAYAAARAAYAAGDAAYTAVDAAYAAVDAAYAAVAAADAAANAAASAAVAVAPDADSATYYQWLAETVINLVNTSPVAQKGTENA